MSGTEVMVLLVLGLVVLGPEKLPDAIRRVSHLYGELKRMSSGVQGDLRRAFDEPMRELRGTAEAARSIATDAASPFRGAVMSAAPGVHAGAVSPETQEGASPSAGAPAPELSLADGGTRAYVETATSTDDVTPAEPSDHVIDDVT